jgi:outer membrane protein assembly factor BamB
VVLVSPHGEVEAIDPRSGNAKWRQKIGRRVFVAPCAAGRCLAIVGEPGSLQVLDSETGMTRWSHDGLGVVEHPPASDGASLFVAVDDTVHRFDLDTGRNHRPIATRGRIVAAPTAVAGRLLIGHDDRVIEVLDANAGTPQFLLRDDGATTVPVLPVDQGQVIATFADGTVSSYAIGTEAGR